jgi:predicted 3-demethylubiquinone-9 3-methyltransferase (glyoxalase superfamily)
MTITGMTTFLWFDNQALEAASFYANLFDGKVSNVSRYQSDAQQPEGTVLTVDFELFGRPFSALSGRRQHRLVVGERSLGSPGCRAHGTFWSANPQQNLV